MQATRPYVMSIAGLDPSGGAGLLADIKAFEANGAYGFGVSTAVTYQNDIKFHGLDWLNAKQIINQIEGIISRYNIDFIKIGIIKDVELLEKVIDFLILYNPLVKIIWDPVLKASAGFTFHEDIDQEIFFSILRKIYLVTPNLEEAKTLFNETSIERLQQIVVSKDLCNLLLKGGHAKGEKRNDILISGKQISEFDGEKFDGFKKHGTGCVLSSAITANLAKGKDLIEACSAAKEYIHRFIKSNKTLLGYHYEN